MSPKPDSAFVSSRVCEWSQLHEVGLREVRLVSLVGGSVVVNSSAAYYTVQDADFFLQAVKCCVGAAFSQNAFFRPFGIPELYLADVAYTIPMPPPPPSPVPAASDGLTPAALGGILAAAFVGTALCGAGLYVVLMRRKVLMQVRYTALCVYVGVGLSWMSQALAKMPLFSVPPRHSGLVSSLSTLLLDSYA